MNASFTFTFTYASSFIIKGFTAPIDIAALSGGAYLLQITEDSLSSFTTKFIKP
jgi:hypothetical protein